MGLAERKAVKEFETNEFPKHQQKINAAAGFDVPVEVKWEELENDFAPSSYNDNFTNIYFVPVANALGKIAADDFGKDALKAGLKKIVVRDSSDNDDVRKFTFENGVLTVDFGSHVNRDDVSTREDAIKNLLESKL